MDGIEILTKTEILEYPKFAEILIAIFLIMFIFGGLMFLGSDAKMIGSLLVFVGIIGVLIIYGIYRGGVPTGKYRYTAIISEDVTIKDIHEKYTAIDNVGDLWMLEDKERYE